MEQRQKDRLLIDRESKQDICLDAPKTSRSHAQIVNIDGRYYLQDLNSTNGTYVKKQLITWHPLDNGDHIRIADYVLVYQEVGTNQLVNKIKKPDSVSKTDN